MNTTPCQCPIAGYCPTHQMNKVDRLYHLCQTDMRYFDLWTRLLNEKQAMSILEEQDKPVLKDKSLTCPHLADNVCNIASDIAGTPCPTSESICVSCTKSTRPQRLNQITLTLAVRENSNINISHIESVIDGSSTGFGTRLANTLGLVIKPKSGCGCKGHQDILDVWTEPYIRDNLEKVIDWLQTEATNQRLPFSRILTRLLLKSLLSGS